MEQRAAILDTVLGKDVDESSVPQLPELSNAPKRFVHTRDGKPQQVMTLKARYGHLHNNNTCITKHNTAEALAERYGDMPQVKVEEPVAVVEEKKSKTKKADLPSTMTRRRSRGRDRTTKQVAGSAVKQEGEEDDEDMMDTTAAATAMTTDADAVVDEDDIDRDAVKWGEFGKPAHQRKIKVRSLLARKRSKSKGKNGFLNWSVQQSRHLNKNRIKPITTSFRCCISVYICSHICRPFVRLLSFVFSFRHNMASSS